ncbi:MAG: helix-turn-helix transcriptional regulator [Okeania sp. SIO2H7]|nr:helix-turn-helix transcriptional regulator [Okeania sp. SIO2H7]
MSERGHVKPCICPEVVFNDHLIVLPIAGRLSTKFSPDGFTSKRHSCRAGHLAIYPAGTSTQCNIETQSDYRYICLQVKAPAFNQAVSEVIDMDSVSLVPQFGLRDPLIEQILAQLANGLNNGSSLDHIYVDTLSHTLIVHLLRQYAVRTQGLPDYHDGLSQSQLHRVLDYIQSHLAQEIRLADLADLLGMSQYYFCRLFRQSMGITPYQFVIQQRVELAKMLLRQPQRRAIADIALECGFSNQSNLCKHFRKITGATPNGYRRGIA